VCGLCVFFCVCRVFVCCVCDVIEWLGLVVCVVSVCVV